MDRLAPRITPLAMLTCLALQALAAPPTAQREVHLSSPPKGFVTARQIETRAGALRVLRNPKATMKELDAAMQAMNPWPSTPEQIDALVSIALERPRGDRIAGNAANRLGRARWSIPGPRRQFNALEGRAGERQDMIHELRIYHCMPGKLPALLERFDTITLRIWERMGIRQAGFWTVAIGDNNHDLYYLLEWESLAEREAKFNAFMVDPEWLEKKAV